MAGKVFVVTGSNKGIGLATVKALCQKVSKEDVVYLTARSVERGTAAVKELESQGVSPKFHPLDVDDSKTIEVFASYLKKQYGGLDVLVNNAGMAYKGSATEPFGVQAEHTVRVNYFGLQAVCKAFFPILKPNARVVNVSSCVGYLGKVPNQELRNRLSSASLTEPELDQLMKDFVKAAQTNTHGSLGWQNTTYGVSKVGVSALTRIQQRQFDAESPCRGILVNHCHPGYVDTDMTSHRGILTIEQGAVASVHLSLIPEGAAGPKGAYVWHDAEIVDWVNGPLPEPGY